MNYVVDRERERERDRQTDRQTDSERERQREKRKGGKGERSEIRQKANWEDFRQMSDGKLF